MPKNLGFTPELVFEVARRYTSRTKFREENFSLYRWATRRRLWADASAHMRNGSVDRERPVKWTKSAIQEVANKFQKKTEFQVSYPGASAAASRYGWLEEVCAHMSRRLNPSQTKQGRYCTTCKAYKLPDELTVYRGAPGAMCKSCHNIRVGKYWRENRAWKTSVTAARRAKIANATPPWVLKAMRKEIVLFYKKAKELEQKTGVPHEVDHIVPIAGKTVCGLHVPWNLQVLPKLENRKKSNQVLNV